jgi:hypothetical protein
MPTQKIFKQRVRARMTKTGESYTAARRQLLRKATEPTPAPEESTGQSESIGGSETPTSDGAAAGVQPDAFVVPDDAMRRATSKGHAHWFALLDAWGATDHGHTEIARWLGETHGVPGWWTQSITVAYERARGLRARHQMRDGFSISASRTVGVSAERALAAFTSAALRERWVPDAPLRQRPTRAALSARFDWSDPPSRVVVTVVPKGADKTLVAVTHEHLPDSESGERLKGAWREWLGMLKADLERGNV